MCACKQDPHFFSSTGFFFFLIKISGNEEEGTNLEEAA